MSTKETTTQNLLLFDAAWAVIANQNAGFNPANLFLSQKTQIGDDYN